MGDTKQMTREQRLIQSNFKTLDKATSGYKMMDMQSYAVQAMQEEFYFQKQRDASLGRQGLARIPAYESRMIGLQMEDFKNLEVEAITAEKEHKKKRDQEREATARAKAEGYTFTAERLDPRGTMKTALRNALGAAGTPDGSGPLEEYDTIHSFESPMESLTFSAGPREHHLIEMLEVRNKLAIYLERAPRELTTHDADIVLAQKRDLYQKMEEALQTYYTAYGVDYKTGQDVNRKTALKARQHLALAYENFQNAFYSQSDDLAEARLNKLRKDETFQQQLKDSMEVDMAQMKQDGLPQGTLVHAGSPEHAALLTARNRIAENPKSYASKKKLINQLYAQMTNCANTMSSIDRQMELANRMLTESNDTTTSARALQMTVAPNRRYGRRKNALSMQLKRLETAVNYLLTGQEPETISESLFLKNLCNVETATYIAVSTGRQAVQRTPAAQASQAQTTQATQTQTTQTTQEVQTQATETAQETQTQATETVQETQTQATETTQEVQTAESEAEKEKALAALETDIAKHIKASADALAEAERDAAEAGEENETAQIRLETIRTLNAGSLSEKLLASSYDASFAYALEDYQFKQDARQSKSQRGKNTRIEALNRSNPSLSLVAVPISAQGKELYQEDHRGVMAQCRNRTNAFQKTTKNLRELYHALDEARIECIYAGNGGVDIPNGDDAPIPYDRFVTLRNYMEDICRHKNKEPLNPAVVNEAREVEALVVRYLKMEEYERRYPETDSDSEENVAVDKKTKRLQKKFAYDKNPDIVYCIEEKMSEDVNSVMEDYASEFALYEAGKADIEAFIREHPEAFKADMTPQERMENFALMDILCQKAKALNSRAATFKHSPFYRSISEEDQERIPDYREFFLGVIEYVTFQSRVIDNYGESEAPVQWTDAQLKAMGMSFADYYADYAHRISGIDTARIFKRMEELM